MKRPIIKKESNLEKHAELFSAFSYSDILKLTLYLPDTSNATNVTFELWNDDAMTRSSIPVCYKKSEDGYDLFEIILDPKELCGENDNGLFYYHYSFEKGDKHYYVSRCAYDLLPETTENSFEVSSYQLTFYSDRLKTPDSMKGKIMYQIFVDRFAKGDTPVDVRDDAVICDDWYNGIPEYPERPGGFVKNNMFFGGTLWGVIEKLDYLKELGVDIIYLNPIFEAYSNHKYDTGDYMHVDKMFGGDAAFDALIRETKKRNIGVILDGVFNHTGSDSIYFNKNGRYPSLGAYNSRESVYADWYYFNSFPNDYRSWWGIEILPKLNGKNRELIEFICGENGVIRHYIKKGAYGWRLDVADELDEELLLKIHEAAKKEGDAPIIGEVWEDASNKIAYDRRRKYFRACELDSVMNYPLKTALCDFLLHGDAEKLAHTTTELYAHYPKAVSDVLMNFLGTHDTERILTVLSGENVGDMTNSELSVYKMSEDARKRALGLLKLAYLIVSTMPGVPCIYYGDEIGIEGGRDPFNRKPYPWGKEDTTLLTWYKKIGELRKSEPVFVDGYYRVVYAENGVFVYERFKDTEKITVVANMSKETYVLNIHGVSLFDGRTSRKFDVSPNEAKIIKSVI